MTYAYQDDAGVLAECPNEFERNGVTYHLADWLDPSRWEGNGRATEMARIGVADLVDAGPAPANVQLLGQRIDMVGGAPTRVWVTAPYSLADARALRWDQAKAYREERQLAGCMTPKGRVQTDPVSRDIIQAAFSGAVAAKAFSLPFTSVKFIMEDNSVKPHNADEVIALGAAVLTYIGACGDASQAIRTAIYASSDPFSVNITTGYPS